MASRITTDSFGPTIIVLGLVFGLIVLPATLSRLWYRYHPRKPRGIHFSAAAAQWSQSRFSEQFRPVAAFVADLLCDQLGVGLAQLEPDTRFVEDLEMTDLEPVEVVLILEEELGITIPEEDGEQIHTVLQLVEYLHCRLRSPGQIT